MGLKWFRARLTINRAPKKSTITSVAGFYRSMSQFDNDVQIPEPSSLREPNSAQNSSSVSTSPGPMSFNPMAGLNDPKTVTSGLSRDFASKSTKQWVIGDKEPFGKNAEVESAEDNTPSHIPRESIELIRDGNVETLFPRVGSRSRKMDFKKKKGRAPLPKMAKSSSENADGFIVIGNDRGSREIEI